MIAKKNTIVDDEINADLKNLSKDKEVLDDIEKELDKVDTNQYDEQRIALIKVSLESMKANIEKILKLLDSKYEIKSDDYITAGVSSANIESNLELNQKVEIHDPMIVNGQRIVEGVFDGNSMIGSDGRQYTVPANYASKSKLVEGDILKLTITNSGSFIFKQIAPIERRRLIGTLEYDELKHQFYATLNGKKWRVLTASVTYFKGEPGDEIVFIVPKNSASRWAAVENIIKYVGAENNNDAQLGLPVDSPDLFNESSIDFEGLDSGSTGFDEN